MDGYFEISGGIYVQMPRLTTADRAHADVFNALFDRLKANDVWLKSLLDGHNHTGGNGTQIPTEGIADGAVTLAKLTLGGGFDLVLDTVDGSLDLERDIDGIPYVRTDTSFAGTSYHVESI